MKIKLFLFLCFISLSAKAAPLELICDGTVYDNSGNRSAYSANITVNKASNQISVFLPYIGALKVPLSINPRYYAGISYFEKKPIYRGVEIEFVTIDVDRHKSAAYVELAKDLRSGFIIFSSEENGCKVLSQKF